MKISDSRSQISDLKYDGSRSPIWDLKSEILFLHPFALGG
jgi:hypothetical protein